MGLFKGKKQDDDNAWYYCVQHRTVEQGMQCPSRQRMGPYPTRQAAEQAMETVAERNQQWDADSD